MLCNESLPRVERPVTRIGDQSVHDGLDLEICTGELPGLAGGSGAGRSVLIHTILRLSRRAGRPTSGPVRGGR